MSKIRFPRNGLIQILSLFVVLAWVASDALAQQSRAGSSRSGARSSSGSSGGSSGSVSRGSSRSSSSASTSSRRTAVSRSSASPRGSAGAARTRPHGGRDVRRHSNDRRGFGYYGFPYRSWNPYWGFWGGLGYYHTWGYGPGYGHYGPRVVYSNHRGYRMGALDLSVRPKTTEVYVDGQYVGLAKQYDGFPGHLWLEKGVYEIAFHKPGYETQTRTVKVLTDLILDVQIAMHEGQAVKPELRLEPDPEMHREEEEQARYPRGRARSDAPVVSQSRVHIDVQPGNAVIHLDGNLLGTGDELAGLHAGLIVSAGAHTLEISRDGFETVEESIFVEPGEEIELSFDLAPVSRAGL